MTFRLLAVAICIALVATLDAAKIKVETKYDKKYDFTGARTYGWRPKAAGEVHLLQLSGDDAAALRERFEPVIVPDLEIWYYVLIGPGMTAQTMGQFLPAVTEWGLPPFAPATQALEIYEQGSLILDMAAGDRVVWRGSAQTEIDRQLSAESRDARIQAAVRDMLKKFPPKK